MSFFFTQLSTFKIPIKYKMVAVCLNQNRKKCLRSTNLLSLQKFRKLSNKQFFLFQQM